jgi:hypothetical protein
LNRRRRGLKAEAHGWAEYLGYVSLAELASVRGPEGPLVERDLNFAADKALSAYAQEARQLEHIVS